MGVRFTNSFVVPLAPSAAWETLLDVERMARCMPGATLDERIDDRTFRGTIHVKLGPVALAFRGRAEFVELDPAGGLVRAKGAGDDAKGRGRATGEFTFRLEPAPEAPGSTRVTAETDVVLTGSIAQYGRGAGMMQAVAAQIIEAFAANLRTDIATHREPASSGAQATLVEGAAGATHREETVEAVHGVGAGRPANAPPVKPISVLALLWAVAKAAVMRLLGRMQEAGR